MQIYNTPKKRFQTQTKNTLAVENTAQNDITHTKTQSEEHGDKELQQHWNTDNT